MPLNLTLKKDDIIVVNGCVIQNTGARANIEIGNQANVLRGEDLMPKEHVETPLDEVYFLIQTVLIDPSISDEIVPQIQKSLARLAQSVSSASCGKIFEAANCVSIMDYYMAMKHIRSAMSIEHH